MIEDRDPDTSSDPSWLRISPDAVTMEIVARPCASRSAFHRVAPRGVVVGINAAPEKGRANAELIAFIAKSIDVPRAAVSILRGESGRHKTIRIESSAPALIAERLRSIVSSALRAP